MVQAHFYSDLLKKHFSTEKEAVEAEKAEIERREAESAKREAIKKKEREAQAAKEKLKQQRATRAKQVEDAIKKAYEAKSQADKLLSEFIKDYGFYHSTITERPEETKIYNPIIELLSAIFD